MRIYLDILIEELKKGKLPEFFLDEHEILVGENPYAREAQAYVRSIVNKLPTKFDKSVLRILISADSEVNAFAVPVAKPPLIVIHKGLLEFIESEDELAAVLVHELHHIDISYQHQIHGGKVEEISCDCASVDALYAAGYKKDAMIRFFERCITKRSDSTRGLQDILLGSHPSHEQRIKNIGNYLTVHDRKYGLQSQQMNAVLPAFIQESKGNIGFHYSLDCLLIQKDYDRSSRSRKMELLREIIQANAPIFMNQELFKKRINRILALVESLKLDLNDPEQKRTFASLLDAMLSMKEWGLIQVKSKDHTSRIFPYTVDSLVNSLYKAAGFQINQEYFCGHSPYLPPFGYLAEFQKWVSLFVASQEVEKAAMLAKQINGMANQVAMLLQDKNVGTNGTYCNKQIANHHIQLQGFSLPQLKDTEKKFPWDQHLAWSRANEEIRKTLESLGVLLYVKKKYTSQEIKALGFEIIIRKKDFLPVDLLGNYFYEDLIEIKDSLINYLMRLPYNRRLRDDRRIPCIIDIQDLFYDIDLTNGYEFSESGRLLPKENNKLTIPTPKQQLESFKEKDALAREAKVDWDLLESNTEKFIEDYYSYFRFEKSAVSGGFVFAEKIIDKISSIAQENKDSADQLFKRIFDAAYFYGDWQHPEYRFKNLHIGSLEKAGKTWYDDGISLNHPFIRHAFRDFGQFKYHIPFDDLFYYVNHNVYFGAEWKFTEDNLPEDSIQAPCSQSELPPVEDRWCFTDYTELFHLDAPPSIQNLLKIEEVTGRTKRKEQTITIKGIETKIISGLRRYIWIFEAYKILCKSAQLKLSLDEYVYISSLRPSSWVKINSELEEIYTKQLDLYEKKFFDDLMIEMVDPVHLINCYLYFHLGSALFREFENIKTFEQKIQKTYQALNKAAKKQLLETLLFKHFLSFDPKFNLDPLEVECKFVDPQFKNWAIEQYTPFLSDEIGQDVNQLVSEDKNADVDKEKSKMKAVIQNVPLSAAIPILKNVADKIHAQRTLSYFLRAMIDQATEKALLKNGLFLGPLADALITYIPRSKDKTVRTDTIAFLLSQGNEFDLKQYAEKLFKTDDIYLGSFDHLYRGNVNYFISQLRSTRDFYNDLTFEQQILVLDQFLFPSENPISLLEGKKYVLGLLFAQNQDHEAQQIVESYLEALEDIAKDPDFKTSMESRAKLILSAMLISNAQAQRSVKKLSGRGEALKHVLNALGPAGCKLAQAIESHPDTPADIKNALKSFKTLAAPPLRWEAHEWVEKYYTPQNIQYLGETLGSGTYGVTLKARKNSGAETAITFLRPNVDKQARDEFMVLKKAVDFLIMKNRIFEPVRDMVLDAAQASAIEVDMNIAEKQQKCAEELYEGLTITVDGHQFTFSAAKWIGHGTHYKETAIVPGDHFSDLPSDNTDFKKKTAKAILVVELSNRSKGGSCDDDRHDGQQKISQLSDTHTSIGNFDFGGMSLAKLLQWQKKLLGHLLGEALWTVGYSEEMQKHWLCFWAKPRRFDGNLLDELVKKYKKQFKNYGVDPKELQTFLAGVKRGLLALGNYISEIKDEDMKTILGAVLSAGIDHEINQAIREKLGRYAYKLDSFKKQSRITIHGIRSQPEHHASVGLSS